MKFIVIDSFTEPWNKFVTQVGLDLININSGEKLPNLDPNICYLVYKRGVENKSTEAYNKLKEKYFIISYPNSFLAFICNDHFLHTYSIPTTTISRNSDIEKTVNSIGGYPVIFNYNHSSSRSNGKKYIATACDLEETLELVGHGEYHISKYIEHNFHIRLYFVNNKFIFAKTNHKYKHEFSTNRVNTNDRKSIETLYHKVDDDIKSLAYRYMKRSKQETSGVDILMSTDNKLYCLEANFPMAYSARQNKELYNKLFIEEIDGLLNKASKCFEYIQEINCKEEIPSLLVHNSIKDSPDFPQLLWFTNHAKIPVTFLTETSNETLIDTNKNYIVFDSASIANTNSSLTLQKNIYGCSLYKKTIPYETFKRCKAPFWESYSIDNSRIIKQNDIPFDLPVILVAEKKEKIIRKKIDNMIPLLSDIHFFSNKEFTVSLKPFLYVTKRRKVILVGGNIIFAKEYIRKLDPLDTLFTTEYIALSESEISTEEKDAFNLMKLHGNKDITWTLEYVIDYKNSLHSISYYNYPSFSEFSSITGDPLLLKTIYILYREYYSGGLENGFEKNVSQIKNIFQRLNFLAATEMGLGIKPEKNDLSKVALEHEGKTMSISNCYFGEKTGSPTALNISKDKSELYNFLQNENSDILPKTKVLLLEEASVSQLANSIFNNIDLPIIIKPCSGNQGKDFYLITHEEQLSDVVNIYKQKKYNKAIVQEFITGDEYRILCIKQKIIAVLYKKLPLLIGNGTSTVEELITSYNLKINNHLNPLLVNNNITFKLSLDKLKPYLWHTPKNSGVNSQTEQFISNLYGYRLNDIPKKNERITLSYSCRVGTHWRSLSIKSFPESIKKSLLLILSKTGHNIAGIDVIKISDNEYKLLEINDCPNTVLCQFPSSGHPRPVLQEILSYSLDIKLD